MIKQGYLGIMTISDQLENITQAKEERKITISRYKFYSLYLKVWRRQKKWAEEDMSVSLILGQSMAPP